VPTLADLADRRAPGERWAKSGLMHLTGWGDRPALGGPAPVADRIAGIAAVIAALGGPRLDAPGLAAERAAVSGLRRGGRISCGGACRIVRAADGWLAVNLPRQEDIDLVPAWLEIDGAGGWESAVAARAVAELDGRAALLGLPVAVPGSVAAVPLLRPPRVSWSAAPRRSLTGARVVDLTSMWAGPLCASILAMAGAEVIKVEDPSRPDGARSGPAPFYDLLHARDRSAVIDLRSGAFLDLLRSADVVLESSRPRALEQLGIDREQVAAETGCVWVAITGRGLDGDGRNRPAFGDDAAVAGGLVATDPDDGGPLFCGDALADPVTGLLAAAGALAALAAGGPWIVDAGLAPCAALLAGPDLDVELTLTPQPPVARTPRGPARAIGADTEAVLAEITRAA
jgi:hypothetical protein